MTQHKHGDTLKITFLNKEYTLVYHDDGTSFVFEDSNKILEYVPDALGGLFYFRSAICQTIGGRSWQELENNVFAQIANKYFNTINLINGLNLDKEDLINRVTIKEIIE